MVIVPEVGTVLFEVGTLLSLSAGPPGLAASIVRRMTLPSFSEAYVEPTSEPGPSCWFIL